MSRSVSRSFAVAAFAGAALLLAQPAAAAEGLANGGFDAAVSPWTASGGISASVLGGAALIGFDGPSSSGMLSQTFTTTADGVFDYAFDAGRGEAFCGCDDVGLTFEVRLDGDLLSDLMPAFGGSNPFATSLSSHYAGSVSLAAGQHTFSFTFSRLPTLFGRSPYFRLDSVEGVLTPNVVDTGAVPEPGVWAMMIAGFGLAGAGLRRRRAALAV